MQPPDPRLLVGVYNRLRNKYNREKYQKAKETKERTARKIYNNMLKKHALLWGSGALNHNVDAGEQEHAKNMVFEHPEYWTEKRVNKITDEIFRHRTDPKVLWRRERKVNRYQKEFKKAEQAEREALAAIEQSNMTPPDGGHGRSKRRGRSKPTKRKSKK